jgi:hypothetical protein
MHQVVYKGWIKVYIEGHMQLKSINVHYILQHATLYLLFILCKSITKSMSVPSITSIIRDEARCILQFFR